MNHDIGLQNTFWTGPGIGNWGRPADCATFMTSQADPEAFCQGKIGSSQTFSERYGKWTGFNEHQNVASSKSMWGISLRRMYHSTWKK